MSAGVDAAALYAAALEAREYAYAPYSGFAVGAAVQTDDGRVFGGCNVENAAYGVSCCAERTALYKAVSEGAQRIAAVAVAGAPLGTQPAGPCPPCGTCRQALYEFGGEGLLVVLADSGGAGVTTTPLGELLPGAFGPGQL